MRDMGSPLRTFSGRTLASIFLADVAHERAGGGHALRVRPERFQRVVSRAIVHDDHFAGRIGLGEHALQSFYH